MFARTEGEATGLHEKPPHGRGGIRNSLQWSG
jgi:hypothetical protein